MMAAEHLEGALCRLQRIVTAAARLDAPITKAEAFEQVLEQLELAGFGPLDPPAGRGDPH